MTETAQIPISPAGDPFYAAGIADMTPSQRDKFLREYHAPEYWAEVRRLMAYSVEESEEEDS